MTAENIIDGLQEAVEASKPKHTPGPWTYRPHKFDDWGLVRGYDDYPVAQASTCRADDAQKDMHRKYNTDPAEANARLIAAAPELLAALKVAIWSQRDQREDVLRDEGRDKALRPNRYNGNLQEIRNAIKASQRAIDKAEGRA
jgi:hypothetical protein